jgi:hypothetical protein
VRFAISDLPSVRSQVLGWNGTRAFYAVIEPVVVERRVAILVKAGKQRHYSF